VKLFLGVDGGQSGTTALIGDESGHVVGLGHAGPCNRLENIAQALARAGRSLASFDSACLGLSGGAAGKEADLKRIVLAKRHLFTHDAWIALAGAMAGEPGIVAIAGTGSIAFGRNREGKCARAGGWGYVFGDEGGAFDIARQALRAALRQEEGWGPPTALHEILLRATGASDANDLLHRCYTDNFSRERVAALAPLVGQAAAEGDQIAHDIMKNAAQSLATLVAAVREQLFESAEPALVSYSGGVFASQQIRERFRMLVELSGSSVVAPAHYPPVAGALLEAYRIAGLRPELINVPEDV
jgi:N-acetylglucosamine kinase-like BadF-type ATPase